MTRRRRSARRRPQTPELYRHLDPARHVNNAIHWAAAEDVLAGLDWLPDTAELEYHRAIAAGCVPRLAVRPAPGAVSAWLLDGDRQRLASARLARLDGAPPAR